MKKKKIKRLEKIAEKTFDEMLTMTLEDVVNLTGIVYAISNMDLVPAYLSEVMDPDVVKNHLASLNRVILESRKALKKLNTSSQVK